jgi:hypothetical protein
VEYSIPWNTSTDIPEYSEVGSHVN